MNQKQGKIIIFSAPSGSGKSTIINRLMPDPELHLNFSVSATSRDPRVGEVDGKHYYFISPEEFRRHIEADDFIEWEEVYNGTCYGTLRSEIDRIVSRGDNVVLDIDVKGGLNIKRIFGTRAIAVFIQPPSVEELGRRLRERATDSEEVIARRLEKADYELSFAPQYDSVIVNDNLDSAVSAVRNVLLDFINK